MANARELHSSVNRFWRRRFKANWRAVFILQEQEIIRRVKDAATVRSMHIDIESLFNDWRKWNRIAIDKTIVTAEQSVESGIRLTAKLVSANPETLLDQTVLRALGNKVVARAALVNANTEEAIRSTLTRSMNAGASLGEIVDDLTNNVFVRSIVNRSDTIGQVMATQSINSGSNSAMESLGVEMKQWFSMKDNRVRLAHIIADGQRVKIGEPFDVGFEDLQYPGDPNGSPWNIINCRCFVVPVKK